MINPLRPGDVLRTHPSRGYWGCAVVLTACDRTPEFLPRSHVAITTVRRNRKYTWASVSPDEFEVVRLTPSVRVKPNDYRISPAVRTAIGIYTVRPTDSLDIVGFVEPRAVYGEPLSFDVGDGTSGRFPLCGPITDRLGWEAVVAWRELHDPEGLERDRRESRERFEEMQAKRLADQRAKRGQKRDN